ncbi:hypothetical protein FKB34_15475 [Glycocaulis profundi]|nr:hypothetical protein FKB34_15475 [Glycocaulis profundi]
MAEHLRDLPPPARPWRLVGAIAAGALAALGLPMIIDQVLHAMGVYPMARALIYEPGDHALAFSYRLLMAFLGGWLAARLSPAMPLIAAGGAGAVIIAANLAAAVAIWPDGPAWHLIAAAVAALPAALAGSILGRKGRKPAAR